MDNIVIVQDTFWISPSSAITHSTLEKVCDANNSVSSFSLLKEQRAFVDTHSALNQMDANSDTPHNILHLFEGWMQCQDFH